MTQLVLGAALGFIIGQGVLHSVKHAVGGFDGDGIRGRIRPLIGGFIKYSAVIGVLGALITLGVWAVGDYVAAKSAHKITASALNSSPAALASDPHPAVYEAARLTPVVDSNSSAVESTDSPDPYADPDFKVQRKPRRAGSPPSLKERFVERSETKARTDLMTEIKVHMNRSQYDCEAADHADKYLKAGLDVWAFSHWQLKYFPTQNYKGATLEQCKSIRTVVDSSKFG
jgi:hypothetical protein